MPAVRLSRFENALRNRRFRWLLLGVVAAGVIPGFAWNAVIAPLLTPDQRFDDFKLVQLAAARIGAGVDPYVDFLHSRPEDQAHWDTYLYPPLYAWLMQPFAGWTGVPRAALIVTAGLLCLGLSAWALCKMLRVRDRQAVAFMLLVFAGFFPVLDNFHWGQVNLLLLALACIWAWSYAEGSRWWGGAALGLGIAVKLILGPLALVHLARREWRALAMVGGAAVVLSSVEWRRLIEYATSVFPTLGGGTGWMGNISPAGALMRLAEPGSFADRAFLPMPPVVKLTFYALVAGVLAVDWWVARRVADARERRVVEAALLVASLPLLAPDTWDGHLAPQLLAICVTGWIGLRRGSPWLLGLSAAAFILMGPASAWYWTLATSGALSNSSWARPLAELPTLGVIVNWAAVVSAALVLAGSPIRVEARLRPAKRQWKTRFRSGISLGNGSSRTPNPDFENV